MLYSIDIFEKYDFRPDPHVDILSVEKVSDKFYGGAWWALWQESCVAAIPTLPLLFVACLRVSLPCFLVFVAKNQRLEILDLCNG